MRILYGRAGGLMPRVVQGVAEARASGLRAAVLVPEQFTLMMERELMERLQLPGLMDIDVLSPRRLTQRVFERGGRDPRTPLDERGKRMALSRVLSEQKDALQYYRSAAEAPGLPDKVAALLTDMVRAGLTAQRLLDHAATLPQGAARSKEEDLARIWAGYDALLADKFVDGECVQADVARRLAQSGVLAGTSVWAYGFDVLPRPLCEVLAAAQASAAQVTVTLVCDAEQSPDGRIYETQRTSAGLLMRVVRQGGGQVKLSRLPAERTDRDAALTFLERNLFALKKAEYPQETEAVAFHAAPNPFGEMTAAAAFFTREHARGVRWDEMALALADPERSAGMVPMALKAAGVPFYMAEKLPAMRHGLVQLLLGALRAATDGWKREDVLCCLKSGFSPVTGEDAFLLDNYAMEQGLRGRKWLEPFTRGAQAETLEPLRLALMGPLTALSGGLRAARCAHDSLAAVFQLLEDVGAYDRLLVREGELLQRNMQVEAAQNRQVWRLILDTLDQMDELLGGARAPMGQVAGWLAAGLSDASISALPAMPDQVMVGEVGQMALQGIRSLCVTGMQDTGSGSRGSLLTERERAELSREAETGVGLSLREQQALRMSETYRTLALPRERLLLCHAAGTQDGEALRPSSEYVRARELFPAVKETGGAAWQREGEPLAPRPALDAIALRLRALREGAEVEDAMPEAWKAACACLWRMEPYAAQLRRMVELTGARGDTPPLDARKAWRLFGRDKVSISRLEEFAACPYKHFVHYGLSPQERRDFAFEADEQGAFFHSAMQAYAEQASQLPDWPEGADEDRVGAMMDEIVAPLTALWEGGPLTEDARSRALGRRCVETAKRAAWLFTRQARNSRFRTVATELTFGEEDSELPPLVLELADGSRVALRGRIDRLDLWESGHGSYLRVVDYKSSDHSLDPVRMWYGLQLQLLLYLRASLHEGEVPAGAFYFHVDDPMCKAEEDLKEAAEKAVARELRLKGVVLADVEVIGAMDAEEPGLSIGKVFTADGSVDRNAMAVDLGEMEELLRHAEKAAAALCEQLRSGRIAASPAATGPWSACEWCDYAALCGFEPGKGWERTLPPMKKEEFRQALANEGDTTDEPGQRT